MACDSLDPEFVRLVQQALAQVTTRDIGPVTADRPLAELGLDSLSMQELVIALEDSIDVSLEDEAIASIRTFADLQKVVLATRATPAEG